jgi:hypothetical protein
MVKTLICNPLSQPETWVRPDFFLINLKNIKLICEYFPLYIFFIAYIFVKCLSTFSCVITIDIIFIHMNYFLIFFYVGYYNFFSLELTQK